MIKYYICFTERPFSYRIYTVRYRPSFNWIRRFGRFVYSCSHGGYVSKETYHHLRKLEKNGTLSADDMMLAYLI